MVRMQTTKKSMLLFSGSSHLALAKEIAQALDINLSPVNLSRFPDGEVSVDLLESVRGKDVFVMQSVALDPDHYLIELLVMVDALKRASAKEIVAVIPYYGYCRQDRKDSPREPITAKLVANLITKAGVDKVLTMDLHAGQLQGFFDIPVDNLRGRSVLAEAYRKLIGKVEDTIVVAPDVSSIKIARAYARELDVDFAIVDKHRVDASHIDVVTLIGDVKNKNVLLADDMCTTGETLLSAAKACQEKGAKRIFAAVTHGLLVGDSVKKLEESPIEALLTTDTIPYTDRLKSSTKIQIVSVAPLLAQAIRCMSGIA